VLTIYCEQLKDYTGMRDVKSLEKFVRTMKEKAAAEADIDDEDVPRRGKPEENSDDQAAQESAQVRHFTCIHFGCLSCYFIVFISLTTLSAPITLLNNVKTEVAIKIMSGNAVNAKLSVTVISVHIKNSAENVFLEVLLNLLQFHLQAYCMIMTSFPDKETRVRSNRRDIISQEELGGNI